MGGDSTTGAPLAAYAADRGLYYRSSSFALPQATQLLRHGFMREVSGLVRGNLPGGPTAAGYLNVATIETDRGLALESTAANDAVYNESETLMAAPAGTALTILTGIGVKNGAVAGDGPYGPGNACIFQASVSG